MAPLVTLGASPTIAGIPLFALLGVAAAVVGAWGLSKLMGKTVWDAVCGVLRPPGALGRALLPLLLPLMAICFFASEPLGPTLQFVVGVVLAAIVWLLLGGASTEIKHEHDNVRDLGTAVSPSTPYPVELLVPVAVALAAALAFVFGGIGIHLGTWRRDAGWSGVIEYFGFVLVAVAIGLRIFGYATNRWRVIGAVFFSLLLLRALSWAGVLNAEDAWRQLHLNAKWTSLILVVAVIVAFGIEVLFAPAPSEPRKGHKFSRASGLVVAGSAAVLIGVGLIVALTEETGGADQLPNDAFGSIEPTAAPKILNTAGSPDQDLAWTFAPVLHLRHDEDYPPTSISWFLHHAKQAGAEGATQRLTLKTLPLDCPDHVHDACGTLTCAACGEHEQTFPLEGFVPQGTFYARIAHRKDDPKAFKGWDSTNGDLQTLIQYWLFYDYDSWHTETVIGKLVQEHQGDWEHVSVGLDAENGPLFAALSAHCGGQVVKWAEIHAAPGRLVGGKVVISPTRAFANEDVTHPIVAVARGSHANYAVGSGHRPPDWGSCSHLPSNALTGLSYASNVRDLTQDGNGGWFAYPKDVAVVTADTPPMSYPGAWGEAEYITFGNRDPGKRGSAPLSPPLQARSWDRPVAYYVCGKYWHGDLHRPAKDC